MIVAFGCIIAVLTSINQEPNVTAMTIQPITLQPISNNDQDDITIDCPEISVAEGLKGITVSIPEKCRTGPIDTPQGALVLLEDTIPDVLDDFCVDQEDVDTWSLVVLSYGGYHPTGAGYLNVEQKLEVPVFDPDTGVNGMFLQWSIEWDEITDEYLLDNPDFVCTLDECGGCFKIYKMTVNYEGCYNHGCIDSRWTPNLYACPQGTCTDIDCYIVEVEAAGEDLIIPGKDVYINIEAVWAGCELPSQEFTVILLTVNPKNPDE